jgi:PIN domain nuclease of toxin-antitoxin system
MAFQPRRGCARAAKKRPPPRKGNGVTVLDASALIGALKDEPAKAEVEAILRRRPPPSISATNLAEVVDWLARVQGQPETGVRDRIDWLLVGGLEIEPAWLMDARLAGTLRARHYHRERRPLSLADCICIATAMRLSTDLATTDSVLAEVARAEGVSVIALPDSTGRRA